MGSDWKKTTIAEIADVVGGGTPSSKISEYFGGDISWITPKDLSGYNAKRISRGERNITELGLKKSSAKLIPKNSVLLTSRAPIGYLAIADNELATNQGFKSLVLKNGSCPDFIYYLLKTLIPELESRATGSTFKEISGSSLKEVEINIPPESMQLKISKILNSLDQKIHLNRQINQTLEQMAQALFKSWFVDFDPVTDNALDAGNAIPDELQHRVELRKAVRETEGFTPLPDDVRQLFPDAFEESELGWIPKGWELSTTGEEFAIKGGSTPSTKNDDFWIGGDIHWTSPKDLSGVTEKIMISTERKITADGLKKITTGLLPSETVLMSSRAPVGYLALTKIPLAINQGYIAIPSTKRLSQEYVLYWLNHSMDEIKGLAGGTTFAEISKTTFKNILLYIPNKEISDSFSNTVKEYLSKIEANVREINTLIKLRDTLLPKLISGELRLDEVEKTIQQ